MAILTFTGVAGPHPSLLEITDPSGTVAEHDAGVFGLTVSAGAYAGFKLQFTSSANDFTYNGSNLPAGGTFDGINLVGPNGVYATVVGPFDDASLPAFHSSLQQFGAFTVLRFIIGDDFTIAGSPLADHAENFGSSTAANLGLGDDVFSINAGDGITVNAGGGADTVILNQRASNLHIDGGAGNNTFVLNYGRAVFGPGASSFDASGSLANIRNFIFGPDLPYGSLTVSTDNLVGGNKPIIHIEGSATNIFNTFTIIAPEAGPQPTVFDGSRITAENFGRPNQSLVWSFDGLANGVTVIGSTMIANTILGTSSDDNLTGGDVNDFVFPGAGANVADGLGGINSLFLPGNSANFGITFQHGANPFVQLTDAQAGHPGGVHQVRNFQFFAFNDLELSADEIAVLTGDKAPRLVNPIEGTTWSSGHSHTFVVPANTFRDPDGDGLTYTGLLNGFPLPNWLYFDQAAHQFVGTPPADFEGPLDLVVIASDGLKTKEEHFVINVVRDTLNQPPDVNFHPKDKVWVSERPNIILWQPDAIDTFTDKDHDKLTYTATLANGNPLPGWMIFRTPSQTTDQTGDIIGDPPLGAHGKYDIKITASDGHGGTASITFTVTVDAPPNIFSSAGNKFTLPENFAPRSFVDYLKAIDPDINDQTPPQTLIFSIAGGADKELFKIDPETGHLKLTFIPDFELPADSNHDNVYEVAAKVTDGILSDKILLKITITDALGVSVTGTAGPDTVDRTHTIPGQPKPSPEKDVIKTLDGNDTVAGLGGADQIRPGAGIDTLKFFNPGEGGDTIFGFGRHDVFAFKSATFANVTAIDSTNYVENTTGEATTAEHRFILDTLAQALWFDPDGTGSAHRVEVAAVPGIDHLNVNNFGFFT